MEPGDWQVRVVFPDWKGYTDDTLAMNCMCGFFGYHGQGSICLQISDQTEAFRMYVNGNAIDTSDLEPGKHYKIDISDYTLNGMNTLQISNIVPADLTEAVTVSIPFPKVMEGDLQEEGFSAATLDLISDLIETDIENGFPSAQLSIVRNGRLVYANAWGRTKAYLQDGSPCTNSSPVTTDTLYDLASVTKMFSVNYALQKLVTDGKVDLDEKITSFLGEKFASGTMDPALFRGIKPTSNLETMKKWKTQLTIKDLLRHQGGFPASPGYSAPYRYLPDHRGRENWQENPFFAGNSADEAAKRATVEMICRTPLIYEPGTRTLYSDVDYMVLGLVVEKITGEDLDTWLKKTFFEPLGLTHITYNPLKNGFKPEDCAATELSGNTRDGLLKNFKGYRTYTLQGEVHDETAYYCMAGISGHAGLFSNATDLAVLASAMFCGGVGEHRFFRPNVIDLFTSPGKEGTGNWGLGWWRQGEVQRTSHFGTQAAPHTIGHQGWTGTLAMIDPARNLVIVYLTNKIHTRVTDPQKDANQFDGNWYTAGTLGFVPQILSIGMDTDMDISAQLLDLTADMALESLKLIPEEAEADMATGNLKTVPDEAGMAQDHPAVRNARSKLQLFEKVAARLGTGTLAEHALELRKQLEAAFGGMSDA